MSVGEISIPSALAVLRLITISNLVGCSIGKSVGLAPARNSVDICGGALAKSGKTHPIGHEAPGLYKFAEGTHRSHPMPKRELCEPGAIQKKRRRNHHD